MEISQSRELTWSKKFESFRKFDEEMARICFGGSVHRAETQCTAPPRCAVTVKLYTVKIGPMRCAVYVRRAFLPMRRAALQHTVGLQTHNFVFFTTELDFSDAS